MSSRRSKTLSDTKILFQSRYLSKPKSKYLVTFTRPEKREGHDKKETDAEG